MQEVNNDTLFAGSTSPEKVKETLTLIKKEGENRAL